MERTHTKEVFFKTPPRIPTIEFDSSVGAWYIRFSHAKIAKTISEDMPGLVYTIDLDERNEVIGFEMIGVTDFTIKLLRNVPRINTSDIDFERARIVPARSVQVEEA